MRKYFTWNNYFLLFFTIASSKAATALDQILSLKLCCIRGNGKSFGGKINGDSKSLATSFKLQNVSTAFR